MKENEKGPRPTTGADRVRATFPMPPIKPSDPFDPSFLMETLNEIISLVNDLAEENKAIMKRLDTTDGALMKMIDQFNKHSHNKLGLCAVPPS